MASANAPSKSNNGTNKPKSKSLITIHWIDQKELKKEYAKMKTFSMMVFGSDHTIEDVSDWIRGFQPYNIVSIKQETVDEKKNSSLKILNHKSTLKEAGILPGTIIYKVSKGMGIVPLPGNSELGLTTAVFHLRNGVGYQKTNN